MNPENERPHQEDTLENFNNFYAYLPGGMYRPGGQNWNPSKQKIVDDLDKIAKDLNIDINSISEEAHLGESLITEAINIYKNGFGKPEESQRLAEAKEKEKDAEKIRNSAHNKMIPIFKALLGLGHSKDDLMR